MTLEDAKKIVETAEQDDSGITLYENYSGRGMFGKKTAGVVGNRTEIEDAAEQAGVNVSLFKWDNMGLDMIAY